MYEPASARKLGFASASLRIASASFFAIASAKKSA